MRTGRAATRGEEEESSEDRVDGSNSEVDMAITGFSCARYSPFKLEQTLPNHNDIDGMYIQRKEREKFIILPSRLKYDPFYLSNLAYAF